jgi:hypothetical protein
MHEDAREFGAGAVEDHPPFVEETPRVDHAAPVAEPTRALNPDGRAGEGRHTPVDGRQGAGERGIVNREEHLTG